MTTDQKKKYEEAAYKEWPLVKDHKNRYVDICKSEKSAFIKGTEYAHPIAHSEGWNEALDDIQTRLMTEYRRLSPELIYDELQKLRK